MVDSLSKENIPHIEQYQISNKYDVKIDYYFLPGDQMHNVSIIVKLFQSEIGISK